MPLRFLVALIVFALSASAEAQQPRNIPRIGFLSQVPVAGPTTRHSGKVYGSMATLMEKQWKCSKKSFLSSFA